MALQIGGSEVLDLNVGGQAVKEVRLGATTVWTPGSDTSPEAQAVLDRMTALNQTEIDAITTFVDGCVADGVWQFIYDFWSWGLNSADYLTGFKQYGAADLVQGSGLEHLPGEGIRTTESSGGLRMVANWDTVPLTVNHSGFLLEFHNEGNYNTGSNGDIFGIRAVGGQQCYLRNRSAGNGHDINATWNHSGVTPRPDTAGLLHEDVIGMWATPDTSINILHPGGLIESASRTQSIKDANPFSLFGAWNGSAFTFVPLGVIRFGCFVEKPNDVVIGLLRARIKTYLAELVGA